MIKVGVNEGVLLTKAEKNDKGTLGVTFTESGSEVKKKVSLLEQMNEGSDTSGSNAGSTTFLLFPPSREILGGDKKGEPQEPAKLIENLMALKNQLSHILNKFTTSQNIRWNVFQNVGVIKTDEDILSAVADETKFKQIYANIIDQFIENVTRNKVIESGKALRLFLVRQSKEKHFGRLRDKFLEEQPFLEDMTIPKDKSKLWVKAGAKGATKYYDPTEDGFLPKFTDYEIKNGLDNPIVSATAADSNEATPEDTQTVENLFAPKPDQTEPIDFSATPEVETPAASTEPEGAAAPGQDPEADQKFDFGTPKEGE
jgi:hypothetical protein